jgi:hypothetical protein
MRNGVYGAANGSIKEELMGSHRLPRRHRGARKGCRRSAALLGLVLCGVAGGGVVVWYFWTLLVLG